jgi:hypothetical protein
MRGRQKGPTLMNTRSWPAAMKRRLSVENRHHAALTPSQAASVVVVLHRTTESEAQTNRRRLLTMSRRSKHTKTPQMSRDSVISASGSIVVTRNLV